MTKSNLKNKNNRLEYRKREEYKKERERKLALKEKRENEKEIRKKIKEEREELFLEKLYARKKKYADRLSKIEGKLGKTQIEVRGVNAQKALTSISKISKVEKVESTKEYTRFFVESKQCHKIIALLQNLCYDYKIINIKVGISKGYLIAIYNPKKVSLIRAKNFNVGKYGEQVTGMCKRYDALVCINAGGFNDDTGRGSDIPLGFRG